MVSVGGNKQDDPYSRVPFQYNVKDTRRSGSDNFK